MISEQTRSSIELVAQLAFVVLACAVAWSLLPFSKSQTSSTTSRYKIETFKDGYFDHEVLVDGQSGKTWLFEYSKDNGIGGWVEMPKINLADNESNKTVSLNDIFNTHKPSAPTKSDTTFDEMYNKLPIKP